MEGREETGKEYIYFREFQRELITNQNEEGAEQDRDRKVD